MTAQLATLQIMQNALKAQIKYLEKKEELRKLGHISCEQLIELDQQSQSAARCAHEFFSRSYCVYQKCNKHLGLQIMCSRCGISCYCNEKCKLADNNVHETSCDRWHRQKRFHHTQPRS
jgi:hypothetical protein